jgi:hypothetical protein
MQVARPPSLRNDIDVFQLLAEEATAIIAKAPDMDTLTETVRKSISWPRSV